MYRTCKLMSTLALMVAALLIAALPAAAAQTAAKQGYDESGVLGNVDDEGDDQQGVAPAVETGGPTDQTDVVEVAGSPAEDASATLPFTGADLGILLALGVVLVGTGLLLRYTVRRSAAS